MTKMCNFYWKMCHFRRVCHLLDWMCHWVTQHQIVSFWQKMCQFGSPLSISLLWRLQGNRTCAKAGYESCVVLDLCHIFLTENIVFVATVHSIHCRFEDQLTCRRRHQEGHRFEIGITDNLLFKKKKIFQNIS